MYSWAEQWQILSNVSINPGQSKRIDCHFCGGKKTLTISRIDGSIVWGCYRASCGARGGKDVGRTISELNQRIHRDSGRQEGLRDGKAYRGADIPECLVSPASSEKCREYLRKTHCEFAESAGLAFIRYSPKEDRVMFAMPDRQGYVGRALNKSVKPRWRVFGDCQGVFLCGASRVLVIVEDAASACSIASVNGFTGCALLGTNMSSYQKSIIRKYDRAIVCLDKDASAKAIAIKGKLEGLMPCTVRFLEEDLKYLDAEKIKEIIGE